MRSSLERIKTGLERTKTGLQRITTALSEVPSEVLSAHAEAELVVSASDVAHAIDQTSVSITQALKHLNPLVLCVMHGGLPYCGWLIGRLHFPLQLGYVHVVRYRDSTRGGELEWLAKPQQAVTGRHVLIVDDVLDEGHTLQALLDWASNTAERAWSTVLVRKDVDANKTLDVDFVALECPDRYLYGCGMDYHGYWRNLPAIYALPPGLKDPT